MSLAAGRLSRSGHAPPSRPPRRTRTELRCVCRRSRSTVCCSPEWSSIALGPPFGRRWICPRCMAHLKGEEHTLWAQCTPKRWQVESGERWPVTEIKNVEWKWMDYRTEALLLIPGWRLSVNAVKQTDVHSAEVKSIDPALCYWTYEF